MIPVSIPDSDGSVFRMLFSSLYRFISKDSHNDGTLKDDEEPDVLDELTRIFVIENPVMQEKMRLLGIQWDLIQQILDLTDRSITSKKLEERLIEISASALIGDLDTAALEVHILTLEEEYCRKTGQAELCEFLQDIYIPTVRELYEGGRDVDTLDRLITESISEAADDE